MATKTVQIAIDATYKGAPAFKKAEADVKGLEKDAKTAGRGVTDSMRSLAAGIGVAGAAFGTIAVAAKGAWDTLQAGSALMDARGDFEDLTAAIGTTADVMLGKLKTATGGMISDAQLMADASNMMATGLGLTEAEIVAFSGAAAQLEWNLDTLTDTLNTGSTRGLKEMGLSIDFVKGRMAELEKQGIATDEAFKMAILEAADKKIEAVGKKSEEAAGQLEILTTGIVNASDAFKETFASELAGNISTMADGAEALGDSLKYAAIGAGELAAALTKGPLESLMKIGASAQLDALVRQAQELGIELDSAFQIENAAAIGTPLVASFDDISAAIDDVQAKMDAFNRIPANARSEWEDWGAQKQADDLEALIDKYDELAIAIENAYAAGEEADIKNQGYTNRQAIRVAALTDKYRQETGEVMSIIREEADAIAEEQQRIADEAARAAEEAAQAWEEYAGRVAGAFDTAITGLQDWQTADLVTPEMDVAFSIGGPSDEDMRIMEEYQRGYDNAAREVADLNAGIGTFGLTQEEVNKKLETANAEMGYYSGLMAGMVLPATETSTAHKDLAFNMDLVKDAIYDAGVNAGGAAGQLAELGVATGQFTPQMAEAAIKAAIFAGALEILSKEWKIGAIDTETFISSVNQVVTDLETNTVVELQTKAATGGTYEEPVRVPAQMEFIDGDPVVPNARPVQIPVTIADDALTTAIQGATGAIPADALEQEITFSAEYAEVTPEGTEAIQTAITAIDPLITFTADYAEVTPGATDAIQTAITDIDGTVTFDGDTRLIDADIRRLEGTRITIPVYYVAQNSVPTGGGGGGSSGGSAPAPGNKSTNMVINFNGPTDAPGVTRAIRNSMAQFYADVAREGVSW